MERGEGEREARRERENLVGMVRELKEEEKREEGVREREQLIERVKMEEKVKWEYWNNSRSTARHQQ